MSEQNKLPTYQSKFLDAYAPRFQEQVSTVQGKIKTGRGVSTVKPGMEQLENIIVNLARDIKRNKALQSAAGCKDFVAKKGADKSGKTWLFDIKDPNKDGIPDYFIYDRDGNLKFVNGYTTAESDWAYRQGYMDEKYKAKQNGESSMYPSMRDYINDFYRPTYGEDFQTITGFKADPEVVDAFDKKLRNRKLTVRRPKDLTPMQAFTKYITTPVITYIVEKFGFSRASINFVKENSNLWNVLVVNPIIKELGYDLQNTKLVAQVKKTSEYKQLMRKVVSDMIHAADDNMVNLVLSIVEAVGLSKEYLDVIPRDATKLNEEIKEARDQYMAKKGLAPGGDIVK